MTRLFGWIIAVVTWMAWPAQCEDIITSLREVDLISMLASGQSNRFTENNGIVLDFTSTSSGAVDTMGGQGSQVSQCEFIVTNGFCVLIMTPTYQHPPVYHRDSTIRYGSAQDELNSVFSVFRPQWQCYLCNAETNELCEEGTYYDVRSDNSIAATNRNISLSKYHVGSPTGFYLLGRFFLAMGLGIDRYLEKVLSQTGGSNEMNVAEIKGNYAGVFKGAWLLKYSPADQYMVREASFTQEKSQSPDLVVVNSGMIDVTGLKLPLSATFTFGGAIRSDFQLISATNAALSDPNFMSHLTEILERLQHDSLQTNLPSGVTDYRGPLPKTIVIHP